jgi:hypothetical protein
MGLRYLVGLFTDFAHRPSPGFVLPDKEKTHQPFALASGGGSFNLF